MPSRALAAFLALVLAATAACAAADDHGSAGLVRVAAAFYPLAWMAGQVGGDRVQVTDLTSAGQEPHDLELAPRQVAAVIDADVVVVLHGFQPAVDDAADQADAAHVFDAAPAADLDRRVEGAVDPHFWLDPVRFKAVTSQFVDFMAKRDPAGATTYRQRGRRLEAQLSALDGDLRDELAPCRRREVVTSHSAFGYLSARYGLTQVGITGLTPEAEPSPARLAQVARFVEDHDVRTIYFETLVSPAVARAVASETGARIAVLDPIEGLTKASAGDDYLAVMRSNLATLRVGQACG